MVTKCQPEAIGIVFATPKLKPLMISYDFMDENYMGKWISDECNCKYNIIK